MITRFAYFGMLLFTSICLSAADTKTYHKTLTPKTLSEWQESQDGKISICFAVDKTTFRTNEAIIVRCAVRNNTDELLTLLRPFGDPFYAHSAGLDILGPEGAISYRGPMEEYVLGTGSFIELAPHTVVEETLELPKRVFPSLGEAGLYTMSYHYMSGGYPKQTVPQTFWRGQVKSGKLMILVK